MNKLIKIFILNFIFYLIGFYFVNKVIIFSSTLLLFIVVLMLLRAAWKDGKPIKTRDGNEIDVSKNPFAYRLVFLLFFIFMFFSFLVLVSCILGMK